ncbi:MAG: hypothetical protein ABIO70_27385 [Pseudomonadota bacterium]
MPLASLRRLLLAFTLLVCCSAPHTVLAGDEPFSSTPRGRAVWERAMTRDRARDVLVQLSPPNRALLDELMFIADLQMAAGNEANPLRLYRRVQRELAEPQVVSPASVALVLGDMARVMEAHQELPSDDYNPEGYEVVKQMLAPVGGAFPSAGTCLDRIASMPDEVAVAFLVQEYFADDHYHAYWMKQRIADVLLTGGYGPLPLLIVEDRLRDSWPSHSAGSDWEHAMAAGRAIVGEDFDAWYAEVRGKPYRWEWFTAWF